MLIPVLLKGQVGLDSLYALLRVQSFVNIIHLYDDGFVTIGYGTDTVPFNAYGSLFTSYEMDGTIRFSRYTLDTNKIRQYCFVRAVIVDSFAYTTFQGSPPIQLVKFNMFTGEIVKRTDYSDMAGGEQYLPFPYSIHLINDSTILINATGHTEQDRGVTQLCVYSIPQDTFSFFFNDYPAHWQQTTSLVSTPEGYILGGFISKGDVWSRTYETRATVIWLDKEFREFRRYLSPPGELQAWSLDMIREDDGSLVLTNCIGRKYDPQWGPYAYTTYRPSIFKLDSEGSLLWHTPMGRDLYLNHNFWFNHILPATTGDGYIAVGVQTNFSDSLFYGTDNLVNEVGENLRKEALIAKVSLNGDSLWSRSYYTADFLYSSADFHDFVALPQGGYLICGRANKHPIEPGTTASYSWILYVDEHGCAVPGCHETVSASDPELPDSVRFFPNPALRDLYIYQHEDECMRYTIGNMDGQILHTFKSCQSGSTAILDIRSYPAGTYWLSKQDSAGRQRTEQWVKM